MFVRRFDPQDILKKDIKIEEAITAIIEDPLEVRVVLRSD